MKLGMLTACLPSWPLDRVARWAADAGYEALEVAVWLATGGRDFEAAHLPVAGFGARERDQTMALFDKLGLQLSAFAYYENNLHPDPVRRAQIATHLRHAIDAAQLLGVSYVGTFIGRDPSGSVAANQRAAEKVFPPLVEYAGERGVKLMIENCVMEGWHPDGYPATSRTRPSCGSGCSPSACT